MMLPAPSSTTIADGAQQAPAGGPPARLPGLEALRFVAAMCVLLLHTRAVFGGTPVFGRGYLGVDFFLMLSGCLMARVQEPRWAAGLNGPRFLTARYKRLWPMMALGGVIGLPLQYLRSHGIAEFAEVSALNFALLPAWWQFFAFPLNIPAWTIFAQLVCEGAHVFVLRRLRGGWLWAVCALMLAGVIGLAQHYGSLDLGAKPASLLPGLARCIFAYLLGMGLGRAWRDRPPPPVPPLLAFAAMPVAVVGMWYFGLSNRWVDLAFVVAVCPLMLAGGMRLRRFERTAGLAGKIGFPLFAWQMPILQGAAYLGLGHWLGLAAGCVGGVAGMFAEQALARRRMANKM